MAGILDLLNGNSQPSAPRSGGASDFLRRLAPAIAMIDPRNAQLGAGLMAMNADRDERAQKAQNQNATAGWLQQQGMGAQEASYLASDPAALRAWYSSWKAGDKPDWKIQRLLNDQGQEQDFMVDQNNPERRNPIGGPKADSVRDQFGLNPIYGKRGGKTIVMQPSKAGGLVEAPLPEGVDLTPGVDRVDLGTAWGITDRSGQVVSTIPKDLAGAEAEKEKGKSRGQAQFDLPRVEQNAQRSIDLLERMKTHPGRAGSTGFLEGLLPARSSEQVDFQGLVDQTKGQSFLEAYNTLRGGGQITEVEGAKAENAISRLGNYRLSDEEYLRAIQDLEDVIRSGVSRAKMQAGGNAEPTTPEGGQKRYKFNPSTGELE
ncbi:hypothetical protein [Mesorhizobium sp. Pch-S]|uniref:hypothetical protein n=1 Tax=Mesorhizobium sp. Pch-S TaxID=2082387 RepID=UPI0010131B41|nr:hypothetical protein [Mesorhizobium sp. Pch-S]QAZ46760.1 hypothetical protein C1M53_31395 [Mesorhizobium sp. Pch-S]